MTPTPQQIEASVRTFLPADGTPVLNRIMLVRVRRSLEASVSQDDYFDAVEALEKQRVLGRLRGAGGQVYALTTKAQKASSPAEKALMEPALSYLKGEFVGTLELPTRSRAIVVDTSKTGPAKGKWARPDFVMVTVASYDLMPGRHIDVHSFELKTTRGGSVTSVHEALAQTRFTHFGHLIWHLPREVKEESVLPEVLAQCEQHGIGFIRMIEPTDPVDGWEVLKTARRTSTHVGVVDAFLQERLSSSERNDMLADFKS